MKVISLVGARPQFVKEAVVDRAFKQQGIEKVLVNSGQHYDANMSDIFFEVLQMEAPKYNLEVGSGKHGAMTAKVMTAFEEVVELERPDMVLVYGDTNTTLAGALVASKMKIPVAHVEAGIRMLPRTMPEEINRVVVDRISSLLFCPSQKGVDNLAKEGIMDNVHFVGDVMYDLFLLMAPRFTYRTFESLGLKEGRYLLMTLHRDYNVDDPLILGPILRAMNTVGNTMRVVFPMHPRTAKRVHEFGFTDLLRNITVIEPLDYLELMGLTMRCHKVVTDSGGLQKESYFAGKQAVVLMPDTGWMELVDFGFNALSNGEDLESLVGLSEVRHAGVYGVYGDGNAGEAIARLIEQTLSHQ
jgi:UDP-N-acetylglucosamine 2-epimerase (non-hydrolysing)